MKCMPSAEALSASCLVETGFDVEQSMMIRSFLPLAKMPWGPFIKAST